MTQANLNLNTTFIKSLIDLDFPFIKTNTKNETISSVALRFNLKNRNQFHVLDLFQLNSSLKQLMRIIDSIKYSQSTVHGVKTRKITNFTIHIWCANRFLVEIIDQVINYFDLKRYIKASLQFPTDIQKNKIIKNQHFLLILGNPWTENQKNIIQKRIIYNNILLVSALNFRVDRPQFGFYKIQNDLADFKKVIVILLIIERVIGIRKIWHPTNREDRGNMKTTIIFKRSAVKAPFRKKINYTK